MAGIGVPATPVRSRMTMSFRSDPPRKFHGLWRLAGRIGCPQSSLRSEPGAGSPRPACPWHLTHSKASNIFLPRRRDASEDETSLGTVAAWSLASLYDAANVLM